MWRQVYVRLRSLHGWQRRESELDEEIRFHLAEEMDERIAAGGSPEEARAAARRDFGNVPLIRELTRETWGWGAAERLLQDVRAAIRGMRRNPGYTCAVVVTLALGIGLNAAMYGMLSRLFLQPPPHVENPDGIHRVWVRQRFDWGTFAGTVVANDSMDRAEFSALRDGRDRFGAMGGYTAPRAMQNGRGQAAESLLVSRVSGDLFALLGARPALGRPILPEDDHLTAAPAAVIGNGYWERRFGGARDALGATVTFDDVAYEIVGVMPTGFSGPDPNAADVWLPLRESRSFITALVRLAPGGGLEGGRAPPFHPGPGASRAGGDGRGRRRRRHRRGTRGAGRLAGPGRHRGQGGDRLAGSPPENPRTGNPLA
ncbi:MAG: ABC transporter permease [Acidobacteria bacterium]|nr:ABC transporter permease [Acidobacteriota bacterium]